MNTMIWPIHVTADSRGADGRRVRMDRTVEGIGDAIGAVERAVASRRDGGADLLGCEITGITLLGQVIRRRLEATVDGYRLEG